MSEDGHSRVSEERHSSVSRKDLTEIQKPHKGTIINWKINNLTDRPTVVGNVYGHPKFREGEFLRTSFIVDIQGDQLETNNSRYTLAYKKVEEDGGSKSDD